MGLQDKRWYKVLRATTMAAAVIAIVASGMVLYGDFHIPGLAPIALGVTVLGIGISVLLTYQRNRQRGQLVMGALFMGIFVMNICSGVSQIINYIQ